APRRRQKRGRSNVSDRAVWLGSKPTAVSGPAKLCGNSAPVLAAGLGRRAQCKGDPTLVMVAALASSLGALLPLSTTGACARGAASASSCCAGSSTATGCNRGGLESLGAVAASTATRRAPL